MSGGDSASWGVQGPRGEQGPQGPPGESGGGVKTITGFLTFTAEYNPVGFSIRPGEDIEVTRLVSRLSISANTSDGGYRAQAINASGNPTKLRGTTHTDPDTYHEVILPSGGAEFMPVAAAEELQLSVSPLGFDPGVTGTWHYILEYRAATP